MNMASIEATVYSLSSAAPLPSQAERRDGERLLTLYRVGSLLIDDRRELCLIKNISAGGMMIRAYCPIGEGTSLEVELKCGVPIAGRATWVRTPNIGIAFDQQIDVLDILSASLKGPAPRMPRIEVDSRVTVRNGADVYRMRARDISQGGLKVEASTTLDPDSAIVVSLPGLAPRPAVVRWSASGEMGITFNRLVTLSELIEWLQHQRSGVTAAG